MSHKPAALPDLAFDEHARSQALHRYGILDTAREEEFDDIAAIAAEVCQTPMAVVNFVDTERQFFKAEVGLGVRETPLATSFCGTTILSGDMMIVPDALQDPRFESNPLVAQPDGLRFYAGALLKTRDGFPIGTVCVLDTKPRELNEHQIRTLRLLARQAMIQLELRSALVSAQRLEARHRQVLDSSVDYAIMSLDLAGNVTGWNRGAEHVFGWTEAEMLGRPAAIIFKSTDRRAGIPDLEMETARTTGRAADERWHVRKGNSRFFALGEMTPLKDDAGQHVGYVKILRDRTLARRQAQRLALLAQASGALLNTDDPAGAVRPILEGSADTIGFEHCYLYDVACESRRLLLRHSIGVTEDARKSLADTDFDGPLCGIVAERAEPLVLSDVHLTREPRYEAARASGIQAYAGFPIRVRQTLVGVISFGSAEVRAFDDDALSFFQTIARFLSLARERADDARVLRSAERRSRLAQEAGRIGTFELEVETGIVMASPEFCRIFGLAEAERVPASTFEDLVLEEDWALRSDDLRRQDGTAPTDVEYRIRRPTDGQIRWISRRAEFVRDGQGNIRSMFGTVQDVTDRRIAGLRQEALLELGNGVRRASTRAQMVDVACHIVRTTLNASRAGYAVIDRREAKLDVLAACAADGVSQLNNSYDLEGFAEALQDLRAGQPFILGQANADARPSSGVHEVMRAAAQIHIPKIRKGELVGVFFVHQTEPRDWTQGEIDFMLRAADRLHAALATARAEEEQAVLNHELSHRLKNSLSMVQAIASQTLRPSTDKLPLQDFMKRIQALAAAHDVLLHRNWQGGPIQETIRSTLNTFANSERIHISGPDLDLGPRSTLTFSMLLHELATNAVKYGALSRDTGTLSVTWHLEDASPEDRDLVILWQEAGGPRVSPPSRTGFGSRLIHLGLTGAGGVNVDYEASGLVANIRAPLQDVQQS